MKGFSGLDSSGSVPFVLEELKLNHACTSTIQCLANIPYSQCDFNTRVCVCQNYHVEYNDTMCLPASLLGYPCIMDTQCSIKVKHSICVDGICACEPQHVPLRKDKCLPPTEVGDYCITDSQCRNRSPHSYCHYIIPRVYGKCQCPQDYHVSTDKYCLPQLGHYCESHEECDALTPGSYCEFDGVKTRCECLDGFAPSDDRKECLFDITPEYYNTSVDAYISPISLGKRCNSSEECQARDPYSQCSNGICECIVPDDNCNAHNTGCHEETFQCRDGYCISWFFVCDGIPNCPDNSDEDECIPHNCPKEAFMCNEGTCLPKITACNGFWECPDGSDEARCYTGIPCDSNAFRCKNGQCKPGYSFCNALPDCADGSDEIKEVCDQGLNCSSIFQHSHQCSNGRCRSSAIACSGVDGCGDASDEARCEVCYCKKP